MMFGVHLVPKILVSFGYLKMKKNVVVVTSSSKDSRERTVIRIRFCVYKGCSFIRSIVRRDIKIVSINIHIILKQGCEYRLFKRMIGLKLWI